MKDLLIDKVIGPDEWAEFTGVHEEISARYIREQISAFPEDEKELRIVIDSPGGDVFEAVAIFNLIRDFARTHQDVSVRTYIQGMAASAASVIALAAWSAATEKNSVVVEDNSIFMIHNSWGIATGNRHDMREAADFLEKVDAFLLRDVYVRRTGKSPEEIESLMDSETWLYGAEILDAGFADEILYSENKDSNESRDALVLSAKAKLGEARAVLQKASACGKTKRSEYRAAAMALGIKDGSPSAKSSGKVSGDENKKGGCMKITVEDLKKDNPDIYDAVVAEGVKKEQARVNRLIGMGAKAGCTDYALECIKNGVNPSDDAVVDTFMEKGVSARVLAAQALDERNIPAVNPPSADKDAEAKALSDAFDKGLKDGGYDDGNY